MYAERTFMRLGKYEISEENSQVGTAVTFLLIGLGAGALVGLLFAPKSGRQLRRELRRKYEDAREVVEEFAEDAKGRVENAVNRGSEWAGEMQEEARKKAAPFSRAIRRG
jgi:gas vesicle protein